jgi:hypothetical protein
MTSACSRVWGSELETAPESEGMAVNSAGGLSPLPFLAAGRVQRDRLPTVLVVIALPGASLCSHRVTSTVGADPLCSGLSPTYITFLLRQYPTGTRCLYLGHSCLVCLGVRRCLDYGTRIWNRP